jgi:hypothetical protein
MTDKKPLTDKERRDKIREDNERILKEYRIKRNITKRKARPDVKKDIKIVKEPETIPADSGAEGEVEKGGDSS